jgi:arsenate reductase
MKTVIFACVHNAGRSQMAAAWLNALAERAAPGVPPQVRALSAGTSPAAHVHPEVLEVMKEVGIDLSAAKPQKLTASLAGNADLLVTMGCGDRCPYVPGLAIEDWPVEDPKGQPLDRVRDIRDQIRRRVEQLLSRR